MVLVLLLVTLVFLEVNAKSKLQIVDCNLSADVPEWKSWKSKHGRKYKDNVEEKKRSDQYKKKNCEIDFLNAESKSEGGCRYAHNKMSDWSPEEFSSLLGSRTRPNSHKRSSQQDYNAPLPPPASVDWCSKGYCTPVKDQNQCGSCWAYSSTAAFESMRCIALGLTDCSTNPANIFSPQYLLDCNFDTSTVRACTDCWKSNGCDGGFIAWDYIYSQGHFPLTEHKIASDYLRQECSKPSSDYSSTHYVSNWVNAGAISEDQIAANVAAYGPGPILVDATNWQSYSSGVMTKAQCASQSSGVNHAVVVVGYGTDPVSGPYWLIRNSWGTWWGEQGFIRIERGTGACNIQGYEFVIPSFISSGPTPVVPVAPNAPVDSTGSICRAPECMDFPVDQIPGYTFERCSVWSELGITAQDYPYGICFTKIIPQADSSTSFEYMDCPSTCGPTSCDGGQCSPSTSNYRKITYSINTEGRTVTFNQSPENQLAIYIGSAVGVVCIVIIVLIVVFIKRRNQQSEIV